MKNITYNLTHSFLCKVIAFTIVIGGIPAYTLFSTLNWAA